MSLEKELNARSGSVCELCGSTEQLSACEVTGAPNTGADAHTLVCGTCLNQISDPDQMDPNHWRCLNDSMWSEVPAVQAMAWRLLNRLRGEGWPVDLLNMLYLEDEVLEWAKSSGDGDDPEDNLVHKDAHGNVLESGDNVTLTQSLKVKGANFTAKRGTAVRGITLVHDNPEHIEGRVNDQKIVILTKFVKKSG